MRAGIVGIERGIEKKQRETDRQVSQVKITITHSTHHYRFTVTMACPFLGIQRLGCSH